MCFELRGDLRGGRRCAVVGGLRSLEVRKRWKCAVVRGARCEWGSVRGGVPLVALVVIGEQFRWWWLVDSSVGDCWWFWHRGSLYFLPV